MVLCDVPEWDLGEIAVEEPSQSHNHPKKQKQNNENNEKFPKTRKQTNEDHEKPKLKVKKDELKAESIVQVDHSTPRSKVVPMEKQKEHIKSDVARKVPEQKASKEFKATKSSHVDSSSIPPLPTPVPFEKMTPFQKKMYEKLSGARFRWLNERLYTESGQTSLQLFQQDPSLFDAYHTGFRHQVQSWPVNPLDLFIKRLQNLKKPTVIADMGCGEARLASTLSKTSKQHQVHSFDLVAANSFITACDISHVPLNDQSVDICVFCLSLMGTNHMDFLREAHRILKIGGQLWISEVVSRIPNMKPLLVALRNIGFSLLDKNNDNKMFFTLTLSKEEQSGNRSLPNASKPILEPCIYKRR